MVLVASKRGQHNVIACKLLQVERERTQLIIQTMKELNTQYNNYHRRASSSQPPLAVNRVKVMFKDEPGEGSGVTRSFYTAIAEVSLYA
jgi:E3 ubiquitin-protein ligase EDD1